MIALRICAAAVVHDGEGGTYPVGAIVHAAPRAAETLIAAGYAEVAPESEAEPDPSAAPAEPPKSRRKAT